MREINNSYQSVGSVPLLSEEREDNVVFPFLLLLDAEKNTVLRVCFSVAAKTLVGCRHSGFELKPPEKTT